MSKFDTNGGHYEPLGYMRVNAGGSHEENPNGGVQVGMDEEGTPNLLEEGEPVYNDYVYSDNITADEEILKKHNVPTKYAGKLYSKIADSYVDEAAEMPIDPIANNGLNAMLVRLADAQEEQKEIQKQQELEEELANLSPEELEELEAILSEQNAAMPQEEYPVEEQAIMQQPAEFGMQEYQPEVAAPIMAEGGVLNVYGPGGDIDRAAEVLAAAKKERERAEIDASVRNREYQYAQQSRMKHQQAERAIRRSERALRRAEASVARVEANAKNIYPADEASYMRTLNRQYELVDAKKRQLDEAQKAYKALGPLLDVPSNTAIPAQDSVVTMPTPNVEIIQDTVGMDDVHKRIYEALQRRAGSKAEGGFVNRFDWGSFLSRLGSYKNSLGSNKPGTYTIDYNFPLNGNKDILGLEQSEGYKNFTRYVLSHENDPNVQKYLRALDAGTHGSVPKLFDGDKLRDDWSDLYIQRRNDQKGGIYHFYDESLDDVNNWATEMKTPLSPLGDPRQSGLGLRGADGQLIQFGVPGGSFLSQNGVPYSDLAGITRHKTTSSLYDDITLDVGPTPGNPGGFNSPSVAAAQVSAAKSAAGVSGAPVAKAASVAVNPSGSAGADSNMLPTWPRYAGALTAGILGLHNAFQEPDKYEIPAYQPVLPQGRMDLIDPVYNPIDQNMAVNNLLAGSAGTTRAITNSGLGTGASATLLAQDYNTGRNIGAAQTQIWDANNQRRNDVIARRNQNAATLGQFNYGQSRDRAAILNDAAWRNLQNEVMQQRLNYAAESQKYAAIQQQLDSVADALSKIGYENAAMNMVNGDDAYAYALNRLFDTYYKGNKTACGGKIKKTKK